MALGVLTNTRGLTELIVLNIGLQAGVIDDKLFTVLVLMALTTVATELDDSLGLKPAAELSS